MTRMLIGSISALLLSAAVAAQGTAQTQQTPPPTPPQVQTPPPASQQPARPQDPKAVEVTLVGCVAQGSSASIFLFENAIDPAKKDEKARSFRLTSSGEEIDLTPHLNHKVQIVGSYLPPAPPATPPAAGAKMNEKDLPVFSVKSVTHVATTCSTPGQ